MRFNLAQRKPPDTQPQQPPNKQRQPMNKQTEADLLGLIDYLKETPEYNTPSDNGKWLDRIITELTKQTETDNNQ